MPPRRWEWAVAGGFTCLAFARVAAADHHERANAQSVGLLSFTPQLTVAAWLGAVLLRDQRAAAVTAAAAAALTGVVAPRAIGRGQPVVTGSVLRVLTANLFDGRAAAGSVVALVRRTGAEVLFVQELTRDAERRLGEAGLAQVLPYACTDLGLAASRGNAIYSRHPLADCDSVTTAPGIAPAATIVLPSGAARLVCVHLHTPKPPWSRSAVSSWRAELRALPGQLAPGGPPAIIAGDFNATVDHAEFRRLLRAGYADAAIGVGQGLVPTWGATARSRPGLLTIDHVLTDPRCAVLGLSVHRLPGTDHRAILASIRLP